MRKLPPYDTSHGFMEFFFIDSDYFRAHCYLWQVFSTYQPSSRVSRQRIRAASKRRAQHSYNSDNFADFNLVHSARQFPRFRKMYIPMGQQQYHFFSRQNHICHNSHSLANFNSQRLHYANSSCNRVCSPRNRLSRAVPHIFNFYAGSGICHVNRRLICLHKKVARSIFMAISQNANCTTAAIAIGITTLSKSASGMTSMSIATAPKIRA